MGNCIKIKPKHIYGNQTALEIDDPGVIRKTSNKVARYEYRNSLGFDHGYLEID